MNWYLKVLREYANFNGRARRKEYWMFTLINVVIMYALMFVGIKIGFVWLGNLYLLATLIPSIAVAVRRMHDVDKSGWYILIPIYSLILALTDSTSGPNQYGPNPKGIGNNEDESSHLIEEEA